MLSFAIVFFFFFPLVVPEAGVLGVDSLTSALLDLLYFSTKNVSILPQVFRVITMWYDSEQAQRKGLHDFPTNLLFIDFIHKESKTAANQSATYIVNGSQVTGRGLFPGPPDPATNIYKNCHVISLDVKPWIDNSIALGNYTRGAPTMSCVAQQCKHTR